MWKQNKEDQCQNRRHNGDDSCVSRIEGTLLSGWLMHQLTVPSYSPNVAVEDLLTLIVGVQAPGEPPV